MATRVLLCLLSLHTCILLLKSFYLAYPCIPYGKNFLEIPYVMRARRPFCFWFVLPPGGAPLSLLNPYMYSNLQELSFVVWHSPVLSVIRIFLKYLMLWRRPFCFDQCCYQGALLSLFTTYMYSTLQELSFGILHTPVSHVIRIS